tara:strand:+ start:16445 stop:18289 length:1845 start_codon:yes stop_codon:yes gene_type:complete
MSTANRASNYLKDKENTVPTVNRFEESTAEDWAEVAALFENHADLIDLFGGSEFKGVLLIADVPSDDGWYFAYETGTYTNAGGLVVDLTNGFTIIVVSSTQTVFTQVVFPLVFPLDTIFDAADNLQAATMKALADYFGASTGLETTDKTTHVAAINEVNTKATSNESILLTGSDAFTHAKRVKADGGTTSDIIKLDEKIREHRSKASIVLDINSLKTGKVYCENPTNGAVDFLSERASTSSVSGKYGFKNSIAENTPCIGYDEDGNNILSMYPQESQILTKTNDFTHSDWFKSGTDIVPNTAIGEDGLMSMSKLVRLSTGIYQRINQNKLLTVGNQYTLSIISKEDEDRYISLGAVYSAGNYAAVQFDLRTGDILYTGKSGVGYNVYSPKVYPIKGGKYLLSVVFTVGVADSYPAFIPSNSLWNSGNPDITNLGNDVDGIYIERPMLTNSLQTTPYIENTTTGTVTRLKDKINTPTGIANYINSEQGVLYLEMRSIDSDYKDTSVISISDGGLNYLWIYYASTGESILIQDGTNSGSYVLPNGVATYNQFALAYDKDSTRLYVNGVLVITLPYNAFTGFDRINFANQTGNSNNFTGDIKDMYYMDYVPEEFKAV